MDQSKQSKSKELKLIEPNEKQSSKELRICISSAERANNTLFSFSILEKQGEDKSAKED